MPACIRGNSMLNICVILVFIYAESIDRKFCGVGQFKVRTVIFVIEMIFMIAAV